jgi:hypothetical protein
VGVRGRGEQKRKRRTGKRRTIVLLINKMRMSVGWQ